MPSIGNTTTIISFVAFFVNDLNFLISSSLVLKPSEGRKTYPENWCLDGIPGIFRDLGAKPVSPGCFFIYSSISFGSLFAIIRKVLAYFALAFNSVSSFSSVF